MRNTWILILAAYVILLPACYKPKSESFPLGSKENPLVMAFVPSTEAEKVLESGNELAALLTEQTGLYFKTYMATSYNAVVEAMGTKQVQVAWLPTMAYVFARMRNGDQVILKAVRNGSPTYRGQILVKTNSPIKTVADLKGKRIAFPDEASASGHLYPKALMLEAQVNPEEDCQVIWAGSHDAAILALINDSVDAACSFDDARKKLKEQDFPDIMETTRVLAYTEYIPSDTVTVMGTLAPELVAKLKDGLLALSASETGKQVLMDLYEIEGLVPAEDQDYDPVRKMAAVLDLDIEKQVQEGK